jgi:hypothetical protein
MLAERIKNDHGLAVSQELESLFARTNAGVDPPHPGVSERRRAPRVYDAAILTNLALFGPGLNDAMIINISAGGALIETSQRICPGRGLDVFVQIAGDPKPVRASVVRAYLHAIRPRALFRVALQYEGMGRRR